MKPIKYTYRLTGNILGKCYYVKCSYKYKGNKYVFTELQARHINNLLLSIDEIKKEIKKIKKDKNYGG